jgi:bifunctional enzyme CysN/CysC/sulfate adenylyltransferase subunit 1
VVVSQIESRINMGTFEPEPAPVTLNINDIGVVRLRTAKPLVFDGYATNHLTGSFILIEQGTNATVGAGMLAQPTEEVKPEYTDFAI